MAGEVAAQPRQLLVNVAHLSLEDYAALALSLKAFGVAYVPVFTSEETLQPPEHFSAPPRMTEFGAGQDYAIQYEDMVAAAALYPEEFAGSAAASLAWRPLVRFMGRSWNNFLSPPMPGHGHRTQAWESYAVAYGGLARLCDNPKSRKSSFGQPWGIGERSYSLILRTLYHKEQQIQRFNAAEPKQHDN